MNKEIPKIFLPCYVFQIKMRSFLLATFAALLVCSVFARPQEDKYTSKFDNINLDEILQSNRLLNNYVNCLLDKGSCTAEGKELKSKFLVRF